MEGREDKSDSSGGCRCSKEEVNHSLDALIDSPLTQGGTLTTVLTIQLSLELNPVDMEKMLHLRCGICVPPLSSISLLWEIKSD